VYVGAFNVLGPVVAEQHLAGARSWGVILACQSIGAVAGAAAMVRLRPARLLYVASLGVPLFALPLLALAAPLPVPLIALAAVGAGVGAEVFEINWSTAVQEQIPPNLLSRVAAYDALGSFALGPVGTTLAGPIAIVAGTATALTGGATIILASAVAVLCVHEVRYLLRGPRPA
jgi:hypothetical protein